MEEFDITAKGFVKGVTLFVITVFFGVPYWLYMGTDLPFFGAVGIFALYILILVLSWAFSPQKYILSKKGVLVKRPLKSFLIPIDKITSVEEKEFKFYKLIRKYGNGGLFSYTGTFWNKAEGNMKFYAKNNNFVMIYADKKYVLSPDDQMQFISQLRSLI